jgi:hypothetical protein
MTHSIEPFALQLFRRHRDGESIEALALGLGIPEERIRQRLRVAALLYDRRSARDSLFALAAELDEAHVL